MTASPDPVTRLFRSCEPNEALPAGDPRYVNCDDVRGENLVQGYARALRRADPDKPEIKLFAGHRGVGKTCELNRLKRELENPGAGPAFLVIYTDASQGLDLNDLDFPDLLVLVASEAMRQLGEAHFSPATSLIQNAWDGVFGALRSHVAIPTAEVGVGFASLTVEFRNRPTSRQKLREAVELHTSSLLDAVNDLLREADVKQRADGGAGLVLIIDGLERLVFRALDGGTNTHDRLFIDRSEQLAKLRVHTIYTAPISLFYSSRCAALEQTFGEHNVPVPMIRLHEFGEDTCAEGQGMKKLREIVRARCHHAQVDPESAFDDPGTLDYLCEMTGGHPRHLLMFLQASMNCVDALPITRAAVVKAVRNYANSLLREIPETYWTKLRAFERPVREFRHDDDHRQMLLLLHVLEYMNGEPWYEINPVIRLLRPYHTSV